MSSTEENTQDNSQEAQRISVPPRTFLRYTIADMLKNSPFSGQVFAHRAEAWNQQELPALSIYMLDEAVFEDSETSPAYDDRSVTLSIEILEKNGADNVDDLLDGHAAIVEKTLQYKAFAKAVGKLGILDLKYTGMQVGFAEDGEREIAVIVMSYDLEYRMPPNTGHLDYFYTGEVTWFGDAVLDSECQTVELATDQYDVNEDKSDE